MPKTLRDLAILQVIHAFFVDLAGPFWILFAADVLGLSASEWGLLSLVAGSTRFTLTIFAGKILDRYGRRKLLIPLMWLTPITPLAFLFSKGFWDLFVIVIVMEVANSFFMPGFQSLVADYTPRDRRGRLLSAMGTGIFYIDIRTTRMGGGMLIFIPSTIAFYLGGALFEMTKTLPFMLLSFGMIVASLWAFIRVRDPETLED